MPYLAFDLDAFENCGAVASGCGLREEQVSHGLLKLWRHCWREKTDGITTGHLKAFFSGVDACEMLLTFGFIAATETGWRVRGVEKYLKLGQRKGPFRQPSARPPGPQKDRNLSGSSPAALRHWVRQLSGPCSQQPAAN